MKKIIQKMNIFTSPIMFIDLNINNNTLKKFILNLEKKQESRSLSNIGGWQSNDLQLNTKEFQPLLKEIINTCVQYGIEQRFKKNSVISITNIWANINGYKDNNAQHVHPYSMISGVYYVECPKDCGNIFFKHPSNIIEYDWPTQKFEELLPSNSFNWWFPAIGGRLYLFPSWLPHRVAPNMNNKEKRISLSFNTNLTI
jgi:uncharacterized protein (TIGR02466 family)